MFIMVLNDGETFTNLAGCQIREVPEDWTPDSKPFRKAGAAGWLVKEFWAPNQKFECVRCANGFKGCLCERR